jgi:hypothetical protein
MHRVAHAQTASSTSDSSHIKCATLRLTVITRCALYQDDWSQVRLAASVAVRALLVALPEASQREQYYSALLPPMCLNRYFVAEGVKCYSQDTWQLCMQGQGAAAVARHIEAVAAFYVATAEVLQQCYCCSVMCILPLVLRVLLLVVRFAELRCKGLYLVHCSIVQALCCIVARRDSSISFRHCAAS